MLTCAHATEQILSSFSMTGAREKERAGLLETDVCYPGLDRSKCKVVGFVCPAYILPIIDHPSELDHGKVRGKREAGPASD